MEDMPENIRALLEKELRLEELPTEIRDQAVNSIGEQILKQIIIDVYQYVPEAQIKELDAKVDADDVEGLIAYIEANIPQASVLMENAAKKVVADFKKAFQV